MRPTRYEPSTSGWSVVHYRRRQARRRLLRLAVGGATLLLAGAMAGLLLPIPSISAKQLVR